MALRELSWADVQVVGVITPDIHALRQQAPAAHEDDSLLRENAEATNAL